MEEASKEKNRLEDAQRIRRKENEKNGIEFKPVYFEEKYIPESGENIYRFNGKYWNDR